MRTIMTILLLVTVATTTQAGDMDADGQVGIQESTVTPTLGDAIRILQILVGTTPAESGYLDMTEDNQADIVDVIAILKAISDPPSSPPIADAGPSFFQDEGPDESVFFDGTLSTDSDGTIISWEWDFGDGSLISTETSPRHSYLSSGYYLVTLTVTDNEGHAATDTTMGIVYGNVDTVGPLIIHTEHVDSQGAGIPVSIQANILDPSGVTSSILFYRTIGEQVTKFLIMTDLGNELWEATIPSQDVNNPGVEYWIIATDGQEPENNTSAAPTGAPDTTTWNFLVTDTEAPGS